MTSTASTTDSMTAATDETTSVVTFEKGSWQDSLHQSATLLDRSTKARIKASNLLWTGAQVAIEEWSPTADTDVSAENLYGEVLLALGTARKGDASKIKTVALAVRNHGLILAAHKNLSKAYGEAVRLSKTVQAQADEDDAADVAVAALAEKVPNSTTTVEGAALLLLSKGIDGAVVAILDALGASNFAAHRAFMRAVSTEAADRVQAAKPKAVKAGPKAGATQAGAGTAGPKANVQSGKAKAKPAGKAKPVKATVTTKAKPVQSTPDVAQHAEPVAVESKGEPVTEPVHAGDAVPDHTEAEVAPVKKAARRAVPVRRPVKASA